jgi:hypothetical protein
MKMFILNFCLGFAYGQFAYRFGLGTIGSVKWWLGLLLFSIVLALVEHAVGL